MYTPLTCELCTETFTIPGEWVKHVQTHTDMLPAKRRRRDSPDVLAIYEPSEEVNINDDLYENFAEFLGNIPEDHESTELRNLLKTWDQENLANHLIAQNVSIPVLKVTKQQHLERLLKNFDMGTQIMFEYNLETWRVTMELPFDRNKISNSSSLSNPSSSLTSHVPLEESSTPRIVPYQTPNTSDEYIPLTNILNKSPKGLMLTEYYKKFNKFHEEQRIMLVALIASYYEEKGVALTLSLSHRLELEVLEQFSTEKLEYYRIGKRGKIYNKFSNMKSSFKSAVSSHVVQVQSKTTKSKTKETSSRHDKEFEPEENAESCLRCLKTEDLSVAEFDQYWKACSRYRLSQITELKSISSVLETWPFYNSPSGYRLIDMDFKICFDDRDGLVLNWDKYFDQLIDFLSRDGHIKDKKIKALMETVRNTWNLSENGKNAAIFWSLHGYFVPTKLLVTRKENKRSSTRFTIRDSQESFLYIGGSIQEIEDHIVHIKTTKSSIQPFVYCVGEDILKIRDIWVYFNDIRYKFENFVIAVDTCFKIMYLFNIDFPPESLTFYSFLESFFYNFKSKNVTTRIHVLSESLKNDNETDENKK